MHRGGGLRKCDWRLAFVNLDWESDRPVGFLSKLTQAAPHRPQFPAFFDLEWEAGL